MKTRLQKEVPEDLLKKLKAKKWYRHGIYRDTVLQMSTCLNGLGKDYFANEWLDRGVENMIAIGGQVYLVEDEFLELQDIMFKKLQTEPNYLTDYVKKYRKANGV